MKNLVVDTDVVSFGFRGDSRFQFYDGVLQGNRAVISFVTLAELMYWPLVRNWGQERRTKLLDHVRKNFVIHYAAEPICLAWAELTDQATRNGHVLHANDAWVAATAMVYDLPLVTHNVRDYEHLVGLNLVTAPKG